MTCTLNGVESTLGTYPCLGFRMTLQSLDPNSKQKALTKSSCMPPTCLTNTKAISRVVFRDRVHGQVPDWDSMRVRQVKSPGFPQEFDDKVVPSDRLASPEGVIHCDGRHVYFEHGRGTPLIQQLL